MPKATHNDLLAYMSKMLVLPLRQSIQVTSLRPNLQGHSLPRHKAILTAIENKDRSLLAMLHWFS